MVLMPIMATPPLFRKTRRETFMVVLPCPSKLSASTTAISAVARLLSACERIYFASYKPPRLKRQATAVANTAQAEACFLIAAEIPASPAPIRRSSPHSLALPDRRGSPAKSADPSIAFRSCRAFAGDAWPPSNTWIARSSVACGSVGDVVDPVRFDVHLCSAQTICRQRERKIHAIQQARRYSPTRRPCRSIQSAARTDRAARRCELVHCTSISGTSTSAPTARVADTTSSNGVLIFAR